MQKYNVIFSSTCFTRQSQKVFEHPILPKMMIRLGEEKLKMHCLVKADIQNWVTYSQNSAFLQTKFFFMCIDFIFLLQCPKFTIQLPYPFRYFIVNVHFFENESLFPFFTTYGTFWFKHLLNKVAK